MKTSLLSLFAGTVFLAGAAGASAGEPVTLGSAELDAISAGQNEQIAAVVGFIAQTNSADVDVDQSATATAEGNGDATAFNISSVEIKQVNKNWGDVKVHAHIEQTR